MTGTAEITTTRRENVLLVPNAALRFSPAAQAPAQKSGGGSFLNRMMPRPPRQQQRPASAPPKGQAQRVWVLRDAQPAPLSVTVGASDGRMTELTGGELQEGAAVITEMLGAAQ
jgi:HlyD family secretion protein